ALKLTGHNPQAPYMARARQRILEHGGAGQCNSFTRFYLALLGQVPYSACPSVPVELVLLPRWCYVNLYAMSSWTRTIVVPLALFSALKPVRSLLPEQGIRELFLVPPTTLPVSPTRQRGTAEPSHALRVNGRGVDGEESWLWWPRFFRGVDHVSKWVEPWLGPLRRRAMRRAVAWMRERLADSDGLGAIFPPMVYTVIVFRALGIADED